MKALYATAYGGIDVLKFGDLPKPVPQAGEVLVAVKASSVNPLDWKIREGDLKLVTGRGFPKILGVDFAGIIIELGSDGSGFQIGDPVYGLLPVWKRQHGAHAEFLTASVNSLRRIPDALSYELMASAGSRAYCAGWPTFVRQSRRQKSGRERRHWGSGTFCSADGQEQGRHSDGGMQRTQS